MNYYNENDKYDAAWLRELISAGLIPAGHVDERSICDVQPSDLFGFTQSHFFAGIGGWSLALQLAGWPADRPVWTGSCPCQPFSVAGKGDGVDDERHLWPDFFRLIKACRPELVLGEQVASADVIGSQLETAFVNAVQRGDWAAANRAANKLVKSNSLHYSRRWLDGISNDLEGIDYAVGSAVIGAFSVGTPHIRQRLYWVANASGGGNNAGLSRPNERRLSPANGKDNRGGHRSLADAGGSGRQGRSTNLGRIDEAAESSECQQQLERYRPTGGLADSKQPGLEGHSGHEHDGNQSGRDGAHAAGPVAASGAVGLRLADAAGGGLGINGGAPGQPGHSDERGPAGGLVNSHGSGSQPGQSTAEAARYGSAVESAGDTGGLADANGQQIEPADARGLHAESGGGCADGPWSRYQLIPCRDGKVRRIPVAESIFQPLVNGLPGGVGALRDSFSDASQAEKEIIMDAIGSFPLAGKVPGRTVLLKGSGNAIVPQVAAEFVRHFWKSPPHTGRGIFF